MKIRKGEKAPEKSMIGVILSAEEVVTHNVNNCYNKFTTIGDNSFKVVSSLTSHQDAEDIVLERDNELLFVLKGELETVKSELADMQQLRAADKVTFDELRAELADMKLAWDKSRAADKLAIENKKAALIMIIASL